MQTTAAALAPAGTAGEQPSAHRCSASCRFDDIVASALAAAWHTYAARIMPGMFARVGYAAQLCQVRMDPVGGLQAFAVTPEDLEALADHPLDAEDEEAAETVPRCVESVMLDAVDSTERAAVMAELDAEALGLHVRTRAHACCQRLTTAAAPRCAMGCDDGRVPCRWGARRRVARSSLTRWRERATRTC